MNPTMSPATAAVLAQIIAVFFLAMIVEARASLPKGRKKRRKELKQLLLPVVGTLVVEIYLVFVIEFEGTSGPFAVLIWAMSLVYLVLTVGMTLLWVFNLNAPQEKKAMTPS